MTKAWRRKHVWTVEQSGLDPWGPWQRFVHRRFRFVPARRGWKLPSAAFPVAAERFINTLRLASGELAVELDITKILKAAFWFDVSSDDNEAFYQLSTILTPTFPPGQPAVPPLPSSFRWLLHRYNGFDPPYSEEGTLSFSAIVLCEIMDPVVVENIRRIDQALHAFAEMYDLPRLKE